MGKGKKKGEVRIPERKELRNALEEMEKLGENERSDGEEVMIYGREEYLLRNPLINPEFS